jgi:hypothetical protein
VFISRERIAKGFLVLLLAQVFLQAAAFSQDNNFEVRKLRSGRAFFVLNKAAINPPVASDKKLTPSDSLSLASRKRLITANATGLIQRFSNEFNIPDYKKYSLAKIKFKSNGSSATFQQRIGKVAGFGSYMKVLLNTQNDPYFLSGSSMLASGNINTVPKISAEDARKIAEENLFGRYNLSGLLKNLARSKGVKTLKQMFSPVLLYVYNESFLKGDEASVYDKPENYKLVWHVMANIGHGAEISEEFLISAETGEILKNASASMGGGGGEEQPSYIQDCSASCACAVKRQGTSSPAAGPNPIYGGYDVDNSWQYLNELRSYYRSEYGVYGANGLGGMGDGSTSPFNESRAKTYWNGCIASDCTPGHMNNLRFFFSPNLIRGCAGAVGGDTYGHEYLHAFIASHLIDDNGVLQSVFLNQYESGAIEEAMADLFGEDFDTYMVSGIYDWMFGTNTTVAKRSMSNPADYLYHNIALNIDVPFPDKYSSIYCGTEDSGGIHTNSTVISHAGFLASVGTENTGMPHDMYNGCKIRAIGLYKVTQILFYTIYHAVARINNFNEFYNAVDASCTMMVNDPIPANNRYGVTQDDCDQMIKALQATGVNELRMSGCRPDEFIPLCVEPSISKADCDLDGDVDDADYQKFRANYGKTGERRPCDINKDGIVDASDYIGWRKAVSAVPTATPTPTPAPDGSPEPDPFGGAGGSGGSMGSGSSTGNVPIGGGLNDSNSGPTRSGRL